MEEAPEGKGLAQRDEGHQSVTIRAADARRFAIYTRQSSEPRDGLSSCETQFHICDELAKAESGPSDEWIGERFDDLGISGRTLDRPALTRLRERIKSGQIHRVYAVAIDRLSRSVGDTVRLLDEFERAGVEFHIVNQPMLSSAPEQHLLRHILASFAQFEREIIAARIAETRAYLKKHRRRLAGPAPYGYDADPLTKQLTRNRADARRVRAIFKRAAGGQTPSEIARRIDHLGWRTKQWVSQRSGRSVGGGRWTARQVLSLLRNPVYLGKFADGDAVRPGCHEPIVDVGTFEVVQEQLDARRPPSRTRRARVPFPLRGKLICPKCRRHLCTYSITRGTGRTRLAYRYYRCRSTAGGRAPCPRIQYPAFEVEQAARDALCDKGTWQAMIDAGAHLATDRADLLSIAWASLDILTQERLLAQIVESIEIRHRNSELRITFSAGLTQALMPVIARLTEDASEPPGCDESGWF